MPETLEEVVREAKETFRETSAEAMTPAETAAFVESIREASGLSAAGFARAFGVAPETAESWLKGESIPQGSTLASNRSEVHRRARGSEHFGGIELRRVRRRIRRFVQGTASRFTVSCRIHSREATFFLSGTFGIIDR